MITPLLLPIPQVVQSGPPQPALGYPGASEMSQHIVSCNDAYAGSRVARMLRGSWASPSLSDYPVLLPRGPESSHTQGRIPAHDGTVSHYPSVARNGVHCGQGCGKRRTSRTPDCYRKDASHVTAANHGTNNIDELAGTWLLASQVVFTSTGWRLGARFGTNTGAAISAIVTGGIASLIHHRKRQKMPTSGRITNAAVEANMEVTARLMRAETIMDISAEDGEIDPMEWRRIQNAWQDVRTAQREASRVIERTDYHVERASGWLKEDGPSAATDRKAAEHGLTILVQTEQARMDEFDTDDAA